MKSYAKANNSSSSSSNKITYGFLPNSLKFISSCVKTASSGVRSASTSVATSILSDAHDHKDQVLWASFDRLELGPSSFKHVLLLGYTNGFQVLDVEEASNVSELVSRRDNPVTFLQLQPLPAKTEGHEGFSASHPLLLVVASEEPKISAVSQNGRDGLCRESYADIDSENLILSPTAVRFYSLRSHSYVHVLRFRSTVYMVRCTSKIVAVGLSTQIYCFDGLTLENKFTVVTYPVPQLSGQGTPRVNIGYGPMAVGPRWLAYASINPMPSITGRLSPQSLTPTGVSPSTSPSSGSLMARYAMESSKQIAAGLINLGDMGYKTFSKYYQEFAPDGYSSPVSSNSSWKVGRLTSPSTEADIAGMVIIKDFVSRAVVSQFRAHTSPISALCFDPSGTLLVTASIHGNNMNIFRIMPTCSQNQNSSGSQTYDWSSSHVHLYKLRRGITSVMIQDICFSSYSQWIAIVSSRGTCHIFALSPFGGETILQLQNSPVDGPTLLPALSLPWWSTSSFWNQQCFSQPPAPITLAVVSRIKDNNSSWLNTVCSAATSAAGKIPVPSGAVSAIFHCSITHNSQSDRMKVNTLEHLLVYSPSGHVIQYKLLPSMAAETETASRTSSLMQVQDEELRVKVEPVQWWDVCRRAISPENEECVAGIALSRKEASDREDDPIGNRELVKSREQSHFYISNSEVQVNSGRIPIWQNSKIYFYTFRPSGVDEQSFADNCTIGEDEIEKVPGVEIEIRRRDLLPVFEHFCTIQSDWGDRGGCLNNSSDSHEAEVKYSDGVISHTELPRLAKNSDGGLTTICSPPVIPSGDEDNEDEKCRAVLQSPLQNHCNENCAAVSSKQFTSNFSPVRDSNFTDNINNLTTGSLSTDRAISKEVHSSNCGVATESSGSNRSDMSMNVLDEGPIHDAMDFESFFQEEYCKAKGMSNYCTEVDSRRNPCECDRDKCEEDAESSDMLGDIFAFSEEG